ncbi:hypothetical protein E2C01_021150 [Portunus trituberculatus]|uniref:Uncharacterized protein n=1 Tax=Portunus trituberculatus TaxID=210409 RepID=A0A5B7E3N2_PORTR|nr:hypothetical protein [Portunus trituberculatus]
MSSTSALHSSHATPPKHPFLGHPTNPHPAARVKAQSTAGCARLNTAAVTNQSAPYTGASPRSQTHSTSLFLGGGSLNKFSSPPYHQCIKGRRVGVCLVAQGDHSLGAGQVLPQLEAKAWASRLTEQLNTWTIVSPPPCHTLPHFPRRPALGRVPAFGANLQPTHAETSPGPGDLHTSDELQHQAGVAMAVVEKEVEVLEMVAEVSEQGKEDSPLHHHEAHYKYPEVGGGAPAWHSPPPPPPPPPPPSIFLSSCLSLTSSHRSS